MFCILTLYIIFEHNIYKNIWLESMTINSAHKNWMFLQSFLVAFSYYPESIKSSFSFIVQATSFSFTYYKKFQFYNVSTISGILIRKLGLGVNMFLIRFYIFLFILLFGYFIEAFTILNFPSSWNGWNW